MDKLVKGLTDSGNIRAYSAVTTSICEEARKIHSTFPTATAALGRALTAGVLMGSMLKESHHRLTLYIKGNGPVGNIIIDSNGNGTVRGTISTPDVHLPPNAYNKLDVSGAVGTEGYVRVIKDLGLKEPYIGQTELISGEIGEDIAKYFLDSEQIPSAVALGVLVDTENAVSAAGGFIIQLMPGATEETISLLERNIQKISSLSQQIEKGLSPEGIIQEVLEGMDFEVLETMDIEYRCSCSRERMDEVLHSLGRDDIKEIIEHPGFAELTCHFCNTQYLFSEEELETILNK